MLDQKYNIPGALPMIAAGRTDTIIKLELIGTGGQMAELRWGPIVLQDRLRLAACAHLTHEAQYSGAFKALP